jgi:tetratricopeptide (TPR) repeat protein
MSKTAEMIFKKSAEYAVQKKYEKSEKILHKLLVAHEKGKVVLTPNEHADLHYFRGKNFCRLGKYNEGANEFDEAYEISKEHRIYRQALSGDLPEIRKTYAQAGYPATSSQDWEELNREIAKEQKQ